MTAETAISIVTASLAAILTVSLVFAYLQVKQSNTVREIDAAIRLYGLGQETRIEEAARWVKYELNPNTPYEQLYADRPSWDKLSDINHYFELVGTLVTNKYIAQDLVFDLMGGFIEGTWEKVEALVRAHRQQRSAPTYMENFELLHLEFVAWASKHPPKIETAAARAIKGYYAQQGSIPSDTDRNESAMPQ